jgi:dimeric dUTPase (all-alpha-NTP-PPase superfamily)
MIDMFKDIRKYHEALGYTYGKYSPTEKMQALRNNALALSMEVAEVVNSTPWKPWRKIQDQVFNRSNAAEEIIDCLFFLGAISEILNISPEELDVTFDGVLEQNYKRIKSGYNNKPHERG